MQVNLFAKPKLGQLLFFCNGPGLAVLVPQVRKKVPHVTLLQGYLEKCIFMHSVVCTIRASCKGRVHRPMFLAACLFVFPSTSYFVITRIFYFPLSVRTNIRELMPVARLLLGICHSLKRTERSEQCTVQSQNITAFPPSTLFFNRLIEVLPTSPRYRCMHCSLALYSQSNLFTW